MLIIQENGRHEANREFRECFSIQRAISKMGHDADIWGLGHSNFVHKPNYNSYDVIFNLENYDDKNWLPDLSKVKSYKILWAIDEHCRDCAYYEKIRSRDKTQLVLHSTKDYATGPDDIWFPNCIDESLIHPMLVDKRADIGFCGSVLNRQDKIQLLSEKFNFVSDIWVLGRQMVRAINSYRIHFNCNIANDINYRSFETVGCGIPLATNANPQYQELGFIDNENCLIYKNDDELADKITMILNDSDKLHEIGRKALELSQKHTYEYRFNALFNILDTRI